MTIQGFFFDLYGTLLVYGDMNRAWSDWLTTFYNLLNAQGMQCDRADFSKACEGFFSAAPPAAARGDQLTVLERRILRLCAAYDHHPVKAELRDIADRIAAAWQTHIATDPQTMPVLKQLKRQQKTVGLVSNFDHPPHVRRLLTDNGWASIFDTVIISSEVGVKKPDTAIFELALQHTGIAPAEAVYVGDTHDDVTGAIAAGIKPIFITRMDSPTDSSALDFQMAEHQPQVVENGFSKKTLMIIQDLAEIVTLAT